MKPELEVISMTTEDEVMAVRRKGYPLYGVQFHPESVLTPNGYKMLENFIRIANETSAG